MKSNAKPAALPADNIVALPVPQRQSPRPEVVKQRFRILTHQNRGGTTSYRVQGRSRDGYVRANFPTLPQAEAKRLELENDFLRGAVVEVALPKVTTLSDMQLRLAETAFSRLGTVEAADGDILQAVESWVKTGRNQHLSEAPRLDDAVDQFCAWVGETVTLRDRTKANLRLRIRMFSNSVTNVRLDAATPELVESYLDTRKASPATKDNDRRVIGRFFSWCQDRPRRWITSNPAADVKVEQGEKPSPEILTVKECEAMLRAAEHHRGGRLLPYVAVSLFGGLRPLETARLTWKQVNLTDGEIRLEGHQTKTGRPRVVNIGPTLAKWLAVCKGQPFCPPNWRRDFDIVKKAAGYGGRAGGGGLKPWPEDAMRHTAISHRFRECGSYGLTAEWAGNSEAIIKVHYQGKVTSEDTRRFLGILPHPRRGSRKTSR